MTAEGPILADRIASELEEIERVARHVEKNRLNYLHTADDGYLKATAFDFHGFYTGLERIFRLIAETLDGRLPGGEGWHKSLLDQMAREIPTSRPAVLSKA